MMFIEFSLISITCSVLSFDVSLVLFFPFNYLINAHYYLKDLLTNLTRKQFFLCNLKSSCITRLHAFHTFAGTPFFYKQEKQYSCVMIKYLISVQNLSGVYRRFS